MIYKKTSLVKFRADVRRRQKTMGSFLDHIRGFVHITFSIGLVPGAAWSYWTFGTCCTSAILSTILLLIVLWERTLLKLLNYVSLVTRMQCKTTSLKWKGRTATTTTFDYLVCNRDTLILRVWLEAFDFEVWPAFPVQFENQLSNGW